MTHATVDVCHQSPPEAKIALFRSLFHGRDDVYPRRFESRTTGKSGYSPACGNEWVRGSAKSRESSALPARINIFYPFLTRWFGGIFPVGTTVAANSLRVFTRCYWTKRATSLRLTLTRPLGKRTRTPSLKPVDVSTCRPHLNVRGQDTVATSGCSSMRRSPPRWREGSALTS